MAERVTAIPESAKPSVLEIGDTVLPRFVREDYLKDIYDLELRDTDVLVVTWPKSGTTWMQYIISQVIYGKHYVPKTHLNKDHLFLELPQDPLGESSDGCYKLAVDVPSPRFLKSHLLMRFLPQDIFNKKAKVIYVARNPKDAAVSYYHFCLFALILPTYSWDELVDHLCEGLLPFGDWFEHVIKWWEKRDDPNVLFIKYEDMKKDLNTVVAQVGKFLNKSLTEDEVNEICYNSSFENMKKQPKANPDSFIGDFKKEEGKHLKFMRKGAVGDWKNFFTVAQSERFDKIYQTKMAETGLEFLFE